MISYDSYHMNGEMIQKSHEISAISGWKDYGKFSGNVQNLCQSRGHVHCASCCVVRYKNVWMRSRSVPNNFNPRPFFTAVFICFSFQQRNLSWSFFVVTVRGAEKKIQAPIGPIPPGHDKVQLRVWRLKLDPWHRGFVSEKCFCFLVPWASRWWWWWYPPVLPCVAEDLKRQVVCHPCQSVKKA